VVDAVDTNVLVRYLLQDDPEMGPAAARLMNGGLRLGVSLVVLTETVFVLSSNYGVPREEVVDSLVELLRKRNIEVLGAEKALVASALMLCRPSGLVNYADG
jgi:predicted nucleic-acid-binding protein